ncbi:unnamed protein product [Adineta ricciae]|uniref:Uncharacterized protein n=1 Tax=Adineta ricciae TaxID=249248 RepID=A0A815BSS8_ADIRI|nr:unnamed protein product [Adineta ricciae]CAF1432875.1 unnamed protein product [Adineta ricciae]
MSITPNGRRECSVCNEEKITYQCKGCARDFCYKHLSEHRQIFIEELGVVENDRDQFREILLEQKENLPNHQTMQKIAKWESESIKKIKQTADDCREIFMFEALQCYNEIEMKLNKLHNDIVVTREENEFNEIILEQLRLKLTKLIEELAKAPNVSLQQDSSTFIQRVFIISSSTGTEIIRQGQSKLSQSTSTQERKSVSAKYLTSGITISGGNGEGARTNQLSAPEGIYLDEDLNVYIADCANHRILKWKYGEKDGRIIAGGNNKGDRLDQLNEPTCVVFDKKSNSIIISDWGNKRILKWSLDKASSQGKVLLSDIKSSGLALDNFGYLFVSDWKKNEIRKYRLSEDKLSGEQVVAGGNGSGSNLNQLTHPTFIFIDKTSTLFISDQGNHRIMKWSKGAKEGTLVGGFRGQGNQLTQLSRPQDIATDQFGFLYVADCDNHRIIRYTPNDMQGSIVIGEKGQGNQPFQLNSPVGLTLDKDNHLYVVDSQNHRIQKYQLSLN